MNLHSLMFVDPPSLSDEAASEMLDFLYELINAFDNQYRDPLQRHYRTHQPPQSDLFEDFDDDLPPF